MSADDYAVIRIHPRGGGYAAVRGFDSDDSWPEVHPRAEFYHHMSDALAAASYMGTEYGVRLHPELEVTR